MLQATVQWMFNNKLLTCLWVLVFSLSISTITLGVQRNDAWSALEQCWAEETPATTLAPTVPPTTEVPTLPPDVEEPTTPPPATEDPEEEVPEVPSRRRRRHARN